MSKRCETLTEIAREVAEILDLDELLSRIAILAKRVIDYRTFGILLVNEAQQVLEPKVALQYGEKTSMLNIQIGEGLVGYSAQHKVPLVIDDVSKIPATSRCWTTCGRSWSSRCC